MRTLSITTSQSPLSCLAVNQTGHNEPPNVEVSMTEVKPRRVYAASPGSEHGEAINSGSAAVEGRNRLVCTGENRPYSAETGPSR